MSTATARSDPTDTHPEASCRNTVVLVSCQALYILSVSVDLTLTGLVGYTLAPNKALATLPFALITVAAAVTTIFASLLMQRIGRRMGFALGALAGGAGGAISVWAITHHDFVIFCVGTASVGVFQAFARYYRLAAADAVGVARKGKAISAVMAGGVLAAVAGPAIAAWSRNLLSTAEFAGSYALVTLFGAVSVILLLLLYRDVPDHTDVPESGVAVRRRPLTEIVRQPIFMAALTNSVVGYAVMMFVMTVAPIAAMAAHHSIDQGASIIQWHLVGMYAPSFVTGYLIGRFGIGTILLAGTLLSGLCSVIAVASSDLLHFYAAMLCLGVGWNFMFIGGSTLLVRSYRPSERAGTTAVNEFSTFAATALASLLAGSLLQQYGWATINLAVIPLLAAAAGTTLWWLMVSRRDGLRGGQDA